MDDDEGEESGQSGQGGIRREIWSSWTWRRFHFRDV